VFGDNDRRLLSGDPNLRRYLAITQDQVVALLSALSEWAGWSPTQLPPGADESPKHAERTRAYRELINVFHKLYQPQDKASAPPRDAIFDAAERDELSRYKGVRRLEHIGRTDLVRLLRVVDRYALCARPLEVFPPRAPVRVSRAIHAHNVSIAFRDRPLTYAQYAAEVYRVIDQAYSRGKTAPG